MRLEDNLYPLLCNIMKKNCKSVWNRGNVEKPKDCFAKEILYDLEAGNAFKPKGKSLN